MEQRRFTGFGDWPAYLLLGRVNGGTRTVADVEADALRALAEEDLPALRNAIAEFEQMGEVDRVADFELYLEILEQAG